MSHNTPTSHTRHTRETTEPQPRPNEQYRLFQCLLKTYSFARYISAYSALAFPNDNAVHKSTHITHTHTHTHSLTHSPNTCPSHSHMTSTYYREKRPNSPCCPSRRCTDIRRRLCTLRTRESNRSVCRSDTADDPATSAVPAAAATAITQTNLDRNSRHQSRQQ